MGDFVKKILAAGTVLALLVAAVELVLLRQPNELSYKKAYMREMPAVSRPCLWALPMQPTA